MKIDIQIDEQEMKSECWKSTLNLYHATEFQHDLYVKPRETRKNDTEA